MRFAWSIVACLLVTALAGCAIHPAPKDFSGVSTYDIVKRIRCETKQAAVETALDYLAKGKNVDAVSRATAARFVSDRRPIEEFHPKLFTGEVRTMLSAFWKTGVAYNFTLDMKETNALGTPAQAIHRQHVQPGRERGHQQPAPEYTYLHGHRQC